MRLRKWVMWRVSDIGVRIRNLGVNAKLWRAQGSTVCLSVSSQTLNNSCRHTKTYAKRWLRGGRIWSKMRAGKRDAMPGQGFNGIVNDNNFIFRHIPTTKFCTNYTVIYGRIVDFPIVDAITIPLNPGTPGLKPGARWSWGLRWGDGRSVVSSDFIFNSMWKLNWNHNQDHEISKNDHDSIQELILASEK